MTTYTFDALNRMTAITDPNGHNTSYAFDAAGNRISVTDARNHTTTYGYDAANRLTSTTNALNQTTSYGYDNAGSWEQSDYQWNAAWGYMQFPANLNFNLHGGYDMGLYFAHGRWYNQDTGLWLSPNEADIESG